MKFQLLQHNHFWVKIKREFSISTLASFKTPYSIGKEPVTWIEKLFEAKIPAKTLMDRAYRQIDKLSGIRIVSPHLNQSGTV